MAHPRLVIAATGSGCGKTTFTCGLLQVMKNKKLPVRSFKCGPDYIDPMFHKSILGIPSKNLDLYFTEEETARELFLQDNPEDGFSVIEGVMGLYDGVGGTTETASTYHLAATLEAPIVLLVNAKGKSRSLLAQIGGYLAMDRRHLIRGVILNHISEGFYQTIKPVIEQELPVKVYGFLPTLTGAAIESRYLGLKLPGEIEDLKNSLGKVAQTIEEHVDVEGLLMLAKNAQDLQSSRPLARFCSLHKLEPFTVSVAQDEAFCFYYEDNLKLLEALGGQIKPFSPIRDRELPKGTKLLLLGGGYPELYAEELCLNASMRESVRRYLTDEKGLCFAECGGFLYLHETMKTADGRIFSMAGTVPGECFYTGRSGRFGYGEYALGAGSMRGHEYHYFESEHPGETFTAQKPVSGKSWRWGYEQAGGIQGFVHLYYPSAPETLWKLLTRQRKEH